MTSIVSASTAWSAGFVIVTSGAVVSSDAGISNIGPSQAMTTISARKRYFSLIIILIINGDKYGLGKTDIPGSIYSKSR